MEEELAYRWEQQCVYIERQNEELAEGQLLKEQQRRHREEKERCQLQQMQVQQEEETTEETAALTFAEYYLADPTPSILTSLPESRDLYDPAERDIEEELLFLWTVEV
ncbi:radial spoke head protein 3 homolog B-like [Rhea pennata]|uniref:radial spoke head protein 3 homolog B-like n=1 Tax=Rhea pennata TaxID=8795 RepID=UPI002E271BA7